MNYMGYYTEINFGASLRSDTPKNIIDTLRYIANRDTESDKNLESDDPVLIADENLIEKYHLWSVMRSCSYYFGISDSISKMWYSNCGFNGYWMISFRSSCKNYDRRLEKFVEWIRPYIDKGSGGKNIYAIITPEDGMPVLYGTHEMCETTEKSY